jgi:hypothetical protein
MKLAVFEKIINTMQANQQRSLDLCKLGVDLINHEEGYAEVISLLLKAYYGEAGADWIDWYMYERESFADDPNAATDADGNPICYDIPSLWKQVEECRVSVDFEEYSLPVPKEPMSEDDFRNLFGKFMG